MQARGWLRRVSRIRGRAGDGHISPEVQREQIEVDR
jgi:hypothetical protein